MLALGKAAPLKAEVRLAQAISHFEADLPADQKDAFRAARSRAQQRPPSIQQVMQLTADIDRQTTRKSGAGRCFGPRLTNILQSIQQFAAVGDIIVGGSQNIIACGVWCVARFALLSAVTLSSFLDKLSSMLMMAGRSAPRYERMALLYPRSQALQSYMSEYFLVVVQLCHKIFKFSRKRILGQLVSALSDSALSVYQSELERWSSCIKEEVEVLGVEEQRSHFKGLLRSSEVESVRRRLDMRIRILERCSTYDYQTTWKQIRKLGNTSLLHHDTEYGQWKANKQSCMLMCTGKLGSGKSVLLANIVNDLNLALQGAACPVAYFFCRHDISESLVANTIIRSLARQLLLSIPDISKAEPLLDKAGFDIDFETIRTLLRETLPQNFKAYVVLDDLDSCAESQKHEVLDSLSSLQNDFNLSFCISLRLDAQAAENLGPGPFVMTIPEENPDIAFFITHELDRRITSKSLIIGDPNLILEIHDTLLRGAQGMFLWVALQIESLCCAKTDEAIRQTLAQLPQDLPATFDRILQRAAQPGENYQTTILELIMAARRPLTSEELREALSVVPGDTEWNPSRQLNNVVSVLSSCGSLIIVDEEDGAVRLIHHSVKQFLLCGFTDANGAAFTQQCAEMSTAGIIVTYLNYGVFETQISRDVVPQINGEAIPPRIVRSMAVSSTTRDIALHLLRSRGKHRFHLGKALERAKTQSTEPPQNQFPFHNYAKSYWQQHACYISDKETVQYALLLRLLEGNAVAGTASDTIGSTLLHRAAEGGDIGIITRLTDKGAELESRDNYGQTALICAARTGREEVVKLLVERGANKDCKDYGDQTALARAMGRHHHSICAFLIESGASLTGKSKSGETLLHRAVDCGQECLVRLLVEHGANLEETKRRSGQTALSLAAETGSSQMVKLLARHGANIETQDKHGFTPLMHAARGGHLDALHLLLARCARPDATSFHGDTALSLAAKRGHEHVVGRLLVDTATDQDARDASGYTALMYAAHNGHLVAASLLVHNGCRLESTSVYGQSALQLAAMRGHVAVVGLLVRMVGGRVDGRDIQGRTAEELARAAGHEEVVRMLQVARASDDMGDEGLAGRLEDWRAVGHV
ncbi:hypothetical protein ACQRIU_001870 [Beauveria bassiana]